MSQAGANTPANHFGGSFGPNEWLVQEMYEKYQSDPSSVDKAWWDFFADFQGTASLNSSTNSNSVKPSGPPIPKSQLAKASSEQKVAQPIVANSIPSAPLIREEPPATVSETLVKPADPIVRPIPTLITPSASTVEPLRGVAARVVQSMEGSLTVPTATSVRVVPAKLLIDNRTVINNHLKRGRGGKVSFTHLIGYAMIKAIRAMPEMNSFFTELDGKPAIGHPEHINLGIAIDLAKPDGTRQLLVPSIKGCEDLDFAQFWSAYEDMVRKARAGSLTVEDFAGTTLSLTNPGTIGTVHSVPRLVQGQGLILGVPDLDVVNHGLSLWDLDREFATGGFGGKSFMKLRRILGILRDSYCRTIGIEYMYIANPEERRWIQEKMEVGAPRTAREEQLRILKKLNSAEAFETFLQTKFVGQKRFSLEGGESVIPILDAVISLAAESELDEVCIGMPHRGRLNVLANIAGKSYGQIFQEFEGNYHDNEVHGSGDVKYHLGTKGTFTAESGATTKIYLAANPSHLEAVNPVLEGIVRAKQDKLRSKAGDTTVDEQSDYPVLPILLHGDAAFAGQGVVSETLSLSLLKGYRTGGTIHIIVNNQVGFTTSPHAARSSTYSTDIAKMIQSPVFHVNGDDPEACVRVARVAFEYRQKFNKDVVIDMICYRRRGHNEGDEPSFTQPLMYKLIDAKRSTRKLYTEALIGRGDITVEEAEEVLRDYQQQLEGVFTAVHNTEPESDPNWKAPVVPAPESVETAVDEATLRKIAATQAAIPSDFTVHPKLLPQLIKRTEMLDDSTVDWAAGEMFAFGSLLLEGYPIRMSGQDVRRGTFSNRHAVIVNRDTGADYFPLRSLVADPNQFHIYDSLLSEYAVMGFEYGYSVERDNALVIWEAQFGDFANGAQTVIDEFISSALQKWGERSSVVLLLPHGYEGQGPDHSSGRIERFLTLCAEQNMTVAQPSTPASYFHLLRWHMKNPARRPLIVFEPKSMLRLKAAASGLKDFTSGNFKPFIADEKVTTATRLIFTSGKVYYDLLSERDKLGEHSTAIARVEQLYPLPIEAMIAEAKKHPKASLLWVQDEPANQGPWPFVSATVAEAFVAHEELNGRTLRRVSRRATASPATGNHHLHEEEEKALMTEAFTR
ncbi:MAG: multifunctional oxoglutarate decarboxylase/oxoglutarate dehydrogenase thiamine pyrophosphate-binding subunit/dihydrolipoyllysine-residue succinyltransferase subunit [Actinobacteria bacterium]|nr:multifunctional oxoglutarate decarboxylase/oxoglutarate dehydrogenase thiamine pyrophosphate-binding subunit/dihydrolipoyllysine-residue succinyltransferase subunit [Actinomycetota bacterium]